MGFAANSSTKSQKFSPFFFTAWHCLFLSRKFKKIAYPENLAEDPFKISDELLMFDIYESEMGCRIPSKRAKNFS